MAPFQHRLLCGQDGVTTGLGLAGAARWVGGVSGGQAGRLLWARPSVGRAAGGHGVRQLCPCRLPTRAGRPAGGRGGTCGQGDSSHRPLLQVVNRLGLDSLSPFNPKERIIE